MAWMDPLTANLLDLLFEFRANPVPLTIGGGFGLYLKRRHLDQTGQRTLFSQLPMPRATNDLDLFIRADVLCDLTTMQSVADALARLGYEPVHEARYMQWKKSIDISGQPQEIKLDLLVGPLGAFRSRLHVKWPRVRPSGDIKLHAHAVEEALHIDESPIACFQELNTMSRSAPAPASRAGPNYDTPARASKPCIRPGVAPRLARRVRSRRTTSLLCS